MRDKLSLIDKKKSLNSRSEATELLDIYTQFKKNQLNKDRTLNNRSLLKKSQKLLRLKKPKLNLTESKEIEVNDEKKKKISIVYDQQKNRNRARIIRLKWDPDEDEQHEEDNIIPSETSPQPIMKASGRDRRKLWK